MDSLAINKLRELPIEGVAERLGLRVKKGKALCCFHDDHHPSLCFDRKRNSYRCYSCGAHGGVIDLVMNLTHKPFIEACRWLADDNNILLTQAYKPKAEPEKPQPLIDLHHLSMLVAQPYLCPEARHWLYDERKIHPAVVKWLGLSSISSEVPMSSRLQGAWFNAPSLLIPYRDIEGNLLTVQARYLGPRTSQPKKPRFQFPAGCNTHLFNLPVLKLLKPGEDLYIGEGPSDVFSLLSAGHKAIGIPSATLLNGSDMQQIAPLLSKLSTTLHIYPDRDEAGEHLYEELLHVANQIGCCLIRHSLPIDCKDFSDYYCKHIVPQR